MGFIGFNMEQVFKFLGPLPGCSGGRKRSPQRDPEVVLWTSGFLEAWSTKAKKSHILWKRVVSWPCRLRRQGQQSIISRKCVFFLVLVPQASTKPLGQQTTSGSLGFLGFWAPLPGCSGGGRTSPRTHRRLPRGGHRFPTGAFRNLLILVK